VSGDDEDVDDDGNDDADDSDNIVDADDDDSEGKSLTCKARVSLSLPVNTVFCCVVKWWGPTGGCQGWVLSDIIIITITVIIIIIIIQL